MRVLYTTNRRGSDRTGYRLFVEGGNFLLKPYTPRGTIEGLIEEEAFQGEPKSSTHDCMGGVAVIANLTTGPKLANHLYGSTPHTNLVNNASRGERGYFPTTASSTMNLVDRAFPTSFLPA